MKKITVVALATVSIILAACNTCYGAELNKNDVENIVKEYITNNGEELAISIEKHLERQQMKLAEESIRKYTPILGPVDAPVTVIEYGDYRCGYCSRVQATVSELRNRYPDKVRFAFKFMPILSKESRDAAIAAKAAHLQGKFWEYHAEIWKNQSRIGEELFIEIAESLELNIDKFNSDRQDKALEEEIKLDYLDGRDAGLQGTPLFVINGQILSGAQPIEKFVEVIEAILVE